MPALLGAVLLCLSCEVWAGESLVSAEPLFSTSATSPEGKPAHLGQYKGKALVVNFWARWCAPCREEIPLFTKQRTSLQARQIEILGLAIEDKGEAVADFAKAYEINYPVLLLGNSGIDTMRSLGNPQGGLPFTLGINRQGQVAFKKLGILRAPDLEALVKAIQ